MTKNHVGNKILKAISNLALLLVVSSQVGAVTVSFDRATFNSSFNYSGQLGGEINEASNKAQLSLQNGTGDQARITSVFIEDPTGALSLGPSSSSSLVLESFGASKVSVIKVVRTLTGLGLKEAKDLVESAPVEILVSQPTSDVDSAKIALDTAGATTSITTLNETLIAELDATLDTEVVLEIFGASKVSVIKVVRTLTGLGLKEAKDLVESAPVILAASGQTNGEIKQALETAGATVSINDISVGLQILSEGIAVPETIATNATVTLVTFGTNKVSVIKAVRAITGLGLKEAKELVESAPVVVEGGGLSADEIKTILETAGATVEIDLDFLPPDLALNPDYQLLLDYKGYDKNPDLLFLFGLEIGFEQLLDLLGTDAFRIGLELMDSSGTDLYLLSSNLSDMSAVPVPPMMVPVALCLILLGFYQRRALS